MKKLFKKFMTRFARPEVGGLVVTAGTDIEGKYSLSLQEVNDTWCICIHKCTIRGGLHYSSFSKDSLVCAIPLLPIIELFNFKRHLFTK